MGKFVSSSAGRTPGLAPRPNAHEASPLPLKRGRGEAAAPEPSPPAPPQPQRPPPPVRRPPHPFPQPSPSAPPPWVKPRGSRARGQGEEQGGRAARRGLCGGRGGGSSAGVAGAGAAGQGGRGVPGASKRAGIKLASSTRKREKKKGKRKWRMEGKRRWAHTLGSGAGLDFGRRARVYCLSSRRVPHLALKGAVATGATMGNSSFPGECVRRGEGRKGGGGGAGGGCAAGRERAGRSGSEWKKRPTSISAHSAHLFILKNAATATHQGRPHPLRAGMAGAQWSRRRRPFFSLPSRRRLASTPVSAAGAPLPVRP